MSQQEISDSYSMCKNSSHSEELLILSGTFYTNKQIWCISSVMHENASWIRIWENLRILFKKIKIQWVLLDEFLQNNFIEYIIHIFHLGNFARLEMFLFAIVDESNLQKFVNLLLNSDSFKSIPVDQMWPNADQNDKNDFSGKFWLCFDFTSNLYPKNIDICFKMKRGIDLLF